VWKVDQLKSTFERGENETGMLSKKVAILFEDLALNPQVNLFF